MTISIKISGKAMRAFDRGGCVRKAMKRAVSRAATDSAKAMKVEANRVVRASKNLPVKLINEKVKIRRKKGRDINTFNWGVDIVGGRVDAIQYKGTRKTAKGVSLMINVGKRKILKGQFIQVMPNSKDRFAGHVGVFERIDGKSKLRIKELRATRPLDVLRKKKSIKKIEKTGQRSFNKTFKRNFKQGLRAC